MKSHLDTEKIHNPIVLTGLMGTGKSALGKMLAESLGLPFYDSDHVIEQRAGITINEIFELYGEPKFRETETKTILELLEGGPCVIATGGGALTNAPVLDAVKEKALSIWLKTDIPTLLKRLEQSKTRPLLKHDNPQAVLEDLLAKRGPLYEQMSIHVETHPTDIRQTMANLQDALEHHLIDETP